MHPRLDSVVCTGVQPELIVRSDELDSTTFESIDLQMGLNFFRDAYLVDFGATLAPLHAQQLQALRRLNYTVVRVICIMATSFTRRCGSLRGCPS